MKTPPQLHKIGLGDFQGQVVVVAHDDAGMRFPAEARMVIG
jgi:hypothetical protein